MGRRVFCAVLSLLTVLCVATNFGNNYACAEDEVFKTPYGTVYYGYNNNYKNNFLASYNGVDENLTLPQNTAHGKITGINPGVFANNTTLVSLKITPSYKRILDGAFKNCAKLKTVNIQYGLQHIDKSAFENCKNLSTCLFASSVKNIGERAFCATTLKNVTLQGNIENIGTDAFADCKVLTAIKINATNGVSIDEKAFNNCPNLKSVTLLGNIKNLGDYCFGFYKADNGTLHKIKDFTLYGQKGSTAQAYAKDYGFKFVNISLNFASVKNIKTKVYNGKAQKQSLSVVCGNKTLKLNRDYTLTYKSNTSVGTATITIAGINNYCGKKSINFKILPKGTQLKTPKSAKGKITVKWKATQNISGYQIQYSTSSKFKNAKTVTVKKAKTAQTTIKKLKNNKKYYIRLRTYKYTKRQNYFSFWSKTLSVKTK